MNHILWIYLFKINSLLQHNDIPEQKQRVIKACVNKLAINNTAANFINNKKNIAIRMDLKDKYYNIIDTQFQKCMKDNNK